jgi:hypothetical protein
VDRERGLQEMHENEEKAAKRLAELEAKKEAELKKREDQYKVRRDQIMKYLQEKD